MIARTEPLTDTHTHTHTMRFRFIRFASSTLLVSRKCHVMQCNRFHRIPKPIDNEHDDDASGDVNCKRMTHTIATNILSLQLCKSARATIASCWYSLKRNDMMEEVAFHVLCQKLKQKNDKYQNKLYDYYYRRLRKLKCEQKTTHKSVWKCNHHPHRVRAGAKALSHTYTQPNSWFKREKKKKNDDEKEAKTLCSPLCVEYSFFQLVCRAPL